MEDGRHRHLRINQLPETTISLTENMAMTGGHGGTTLDHHQGIQVRQKTNGDITRGLIRALIRDQIPTVVHQIDQEMNLTITTVIGTTLRRHHLNGITVAVDNHKMFKEIKLQLKICPLA